MKLTNSIIFVVLIFLSASLNNYSQDSKMMVSAYAGYYLPTGNAADYYKSSVGFQGQFEYKVTQDIGIDATAGYIPWSFENGSSSQSFNIIPTMIGGRYYFSAKGMSSYAGLDLGMYHFNSENDYGSYSESKFGFSILGGVLFPIGDFLFLNGNVNYTNINSEGYNFTYVAIHAGLSLPL
jgi:hypothetical protein